tara:strand:+ start:4324 stop:5112 length:789 start_codon:yes stop_codon:yes gene_type:complete
MENQSSSDISTLVHNEFDLSDDNSLKGKHRFNVKFSRKCIVISLIIALIIVSIPVFYVISDYEYSGIEARLSGHGHHLTFHERVILECNDVNENPDGCCEVFSRCSVNPDGRSLKFHTEYINPHLIDKTKRTCPSMTEIVNKYNLHYSQFHYNHQDGYYDENIPCEMSRYGCCPTLDITCDYVLRNNPNDEDAVNKFKNNKVRLPSTEAKVDQRGSNCYNSIYGHVSSYNEHWKIHFDDGTGTIVLLVILLIAVMCGLDCNS